MFPKFLASFYVHLRFLYLSKIQGLEESWKEHFNVLKLAETFMGQRQKVLWKLLLCKLPLTWNEKILFSCEGNQSQWKVRLFRIIFGPADCVHRPCWVSQWWIYAFSKKLLWSFKDLLRFGLNAWLWMTFTFEDLRRHTGLLADWLAGMKLCILNSLMYMLFMCLKKIRKCLLVFA